MNIGRKYGFLWFTLLFFLVSFAGHWVCGALVYWQEPGSHSFGQYAIEMSRDTLENWQSEFLQLIWQVVGLSLLLYVGSSQSKEGDERLEAKVDWLLDQTDAGRRKRSELDVLFERRCGEHKSTSP
jgi:hypothetical protein